MKKISLLLFVLIWVSHAFSQEKDLTQIADSIKNEGLTLYKSEWASWYGTDIFTEKCKSKRQQAGGYLSYDSGEGLVNVFFSKEPDARVISTIIFGYDFNADKYKLDTIERALSNAEKELYAIRQEAISQIGKDTLFKSYRNTELNPVPIIVNGNKRVYILTGTNSSGVIIFGNDYLLTFNNKNDLLTKKKLHKGLIVTQYKYSGADSTKIQLAGIHSHLPEYSEFITATDICTLMLYGKFTTWNQYMITSKSYVSIWDCKRHNLAIITWEAWKKINAGRDALENNTH